MPRDKQSRKIIITWCVYAVLVAVILCVLFAVNNRYARQAMNVAGIIVLLFFLRFLYRTYVKGRFRKLDGFIGRTIKQIKKLAERIFRPGKARSKGGFGKFNSRIRGTDVKGFEIDPGLFSRLRDKSGPRKKISLRGDMPDRRVVLNTYIIFILLRIRRGYAYKPTLTARETLADLRERDRPGAEPPDTLFGQYEKARYAEDFEISGEALEECKKSARR